MTKVYEEKYRGDCPLEDTDLVNFVAWFDYNYPHLKCLLIHVPNESKMPVQGRVKLRDKGLRKGVPDLMFLHPRADYHGLMIEMKRKDKSKCKVSKEQSMYADELTSEGYYHAFTYGLDQVKKCMKDYLAL
jgi:hypothetical protein